MKAITMVKFTFKNVAHAFLSKTLQLGNLLVKSKMLTRGAVGQQPAPTRRAQSIALATGHRGGDRYN